MAFRAYAPDNVDSCDGYCREEILQTQQTSVRIVTVDGDAVRTGRMFGVFADTIPVETP